MLLFRSKEHVRAWYQRRAMPMGATLTLKQQWDLARIWYADRLSLDWRRRTHQEAQHILESLGLIGEFWRLVD